jgi:glutathione synthase/RimK-type ligase-like ATP-grasp enzyme
MILILSRHTDPHAKQVAGLLRERGVDPTWVDPGDFPSKLEISLEHQKHGPRLRIRTPSGLINLNEVQIAWYRRPNKPRVADSIRAPAMRAYVALELALCIEGLCEALDCTWLPALHSVLAQADHKLKQLTVARKVGFAIPPTLITNQASELVRFYEENDGQLISKLPSPAAFRAEPRIAIRYTQPVTRSDLGYWPRLRSSPMVFQRRIPKAVEIRVTVVGQRVFAASIYSQSNRRTRDDSRADFDRTPYEAHELPQVVEERCLRLTANLHLLFSTIDLILTPDGEYVFLELNPNGQYLWIEKFTGLPISEAIADLLIHYEESHDAACVRQR